MSEAETSAAEEPSRVKGSALVGIVKALRHLGDVGREATAPELRHYLESRILSTSWHSVQDYLGLMGALASVIETPPGVDPWEFIGRTGAENYQEGVYRTLFRSQDPVSTLKNYDILWKSRYERGRVVVDIEAPERARVEIVDAAIVSTDFCKAAQGLIWGLLNQGGAKDIDIQKLRCRARGDALCSWQASWTRRG